MCIVRRPRAGIGVHGGRVGCMRGRGGWMEVEEVWKGGAYGI